MAKKKALVDFNSEGKKRFNNIDIPYRSIVFRQSRRCHGQSHGGFEDWISLQSRPEAETSGKVIEMMNLS